MLLPRALEGREKSVSPLGIASLLAPLMPGSSNSPFCRESDKAYVLLSWPPCRVLTCWELQKQRQKQRETHRDRRDDDDVKGQAISQRCSSQEESSPQRCCTSVGHDATCVWRAVHAEFRGASTRWVLTRVRNSGKPFSFFLYFLFFSFAAAAKKKGRARPIEDPGFSSSRALALTRSALLWIWARTRRCAVAGLVIRSRNHLIARIKPSGGG
ncbi:hypothetical protein M441DRAFT_321041 [Trichoderma asperellum CBS 433.97]|uniref:Uncharacterized protein n=1 Tax=Trichoderma asperellum (strain ATCC 204424 / CBS 433.97 / NBRC 101777) TaxID=1042311 RepID=A0A2T3ZLA2_TRIA4|nr:hypothetical protein M441DRAFT_321041 [Trichoderma asperellum CBS 433.97]PTB45580.1 hypothetical protein M441DRAFT_321041 [Trichoderma asperellum CBS 433.97]